MARVWSLLQSDGGIASDSLFSFWNYFTAAEEASPQVEMGLRAFAASAAEEGLLAERAALCVVRGALCAERCALCVVRGASVARSPMLQRGVNWI